MQPSNKKLASAASPESVWCSGMRLREAQEGQHTGDLALILSPTNCSYKQLHSSIYSIFLINSSWRNWDRKSELWLLPASKSETFHQRGFPWANVAALFFQSIWNSFYFLLKSEADSTLFLKTVHYYLLAFSTLSIKISRSYERIASLIFCNDFVSTRFNSFHP